MNEVCRIVASCRSLLVLKLVGAELARVVVRQGRDELAELPLLVSRRSVGHVGGHGVQQCPAVSAEHVAFYRAVDVVRRRRTGLARRRRRRRLRCR